jgi:hypothetical protein
VSDAIYALLSGKAYPTSQGLQRRDFMHVCDAASAFAALRGPKPRDAAVRGPSLLTKGVFCRKSGLSHVWIGSKTGPKAIWRLVTRLLGLGRIGLSGQIIDLAARSDNLRRAGDR